MKSEAWINLYIYMYIFVGAWLEARDCVLSSSVTRRIINTFFWTEMMMNPSENMM